ncbi:MAG: hypothetical protein HOO87_02405 [Methyloglobulus sp.]|nr:hypothetical protein [Methyloglobulus sp.]
MSTLVFLAVIRVGVIDLARTLYKDIVDQKKGGAVLGFVWQNIGVQLPEKKVRQVCLCMFIDSILQNTVNNARNSYT